MKLQKNKVSATAGTMIFNHFCIMMLVWYADDFLLFKCGWTVAVLNMLSIVLLIVTSKNCLKEQWLKPRLYTLFFMFMKQNTPAGSKSNNYTCMLDRFSYTLQISLRMCLWNDIFCVFWMLFCSYRFINELMVFAAHSPSINTLDEKTDNVKGQ